MDIDLRTKLDLLRSIKVDNDTPGGAKLNPWDQLSSVFEHGAEDGHLHIVVRRPAGPVMPAGSGLSGSGSRNSSESHITRPFNSESSLLLVCSAVSGLEAYQNARTYLWGQNRFEFRQADGENFTIMDLTHVKPHD